MTAKEKAKELIKKFRNEYKWVELDYPIDLYRDAKQCALICVEEVLSQLSRFETSSLNGAKAEMAINYFQEVKNEINLI